MRLDAYVKYHRSYFIAAIRRETKIIQNKRLCNYFVCVQIKNQKLKTKTPKKTRRIKKNQPKTNQNWDKNGFTIYNSITKCDYKQTIIMFTHVTNELMNHLMTPVTNRSRSK